MYMDIYFYADIDSYIQCSEFHHLWAEESSQMASLWCDSSNISYKIKIILTQCCMHT